MVRRVIGSILHGGPISHSSQCSVPGVPRTVDCDILSVDGAYKKMKPM